MVPHREVQSLPSQVLSDPTPHCQNSGIFYWFFIPFYVSFLYWFFFFLLLLYMFSLSLLLLFLLSLVSQVLSCSFLCLLCLTGSFFDSISVSLEFPFSICFPSNQCLSCLKLQWSSVCPVGYLRYCDKQDEFSSVFPADLKCCHPSNWRWFHIFKMSGARMILNKQYFTEKSQWDYPYSPWSPYPWLAVSANRQIRYWSTSLSLTLNSQVFMWICQCISK